MIVVDASAAVDLVLGPGSPAGDELARRLGDGEVVVAPHLLDVECGQALRRFVLDGSIEPTDAAARLTDLLDLPVHRYPYGDLVARAFGLHANVTVYDGVYLALAEAVEAPLLTADARLVDVPGCAAEVVVP